MIDYQEKNENENVNNNLTVDNKDPVLRTSEKKLTNSFTENDKQQMNFLQKAAILKHLLKHFVSNRETNILKNSRSIREHYQNKVKENKLHSMINHGIIGIVKEKQRKKTMKNVDVPKKNPKFVRKPTNVRKYFKLFIIN